MEQNIYLNNLFNLTCYTSKVIDTLHFSAIFFFLLLLLL